MGIVIQMLGQMVAQIGYTLKMTRIAEDGQWVLCEKRWDQIIELGFVSNHLLNTRLLPTAVSHRLCCH